MTRRTRELVAVACALWASASVAGEAPGVVRVKLEVQAPAHDLALLGLAVRDVGKLATSGVLREWARQGAVVLSQAGAKASAGLRELVEAVQALGRAVDKLLAEGKAVATREGLVFSTPEGARALQHAWFSVRGELATERALAGLRKAGALTPEVERTLSALSSLQSLPGANPSWYVRIS